MSGSYCNRDNLLQAQAEMNHMIDKLSHTRQEYTSMRDQCAAQLQQLDDEQAAYELEQAQLPQPSGVDYAALQVCACNS